MKKLTYILLAIILTLRIGSSAHYIVGIVEDPLDGSSSNGRIITAWNIENGQGDNQTDIIGPTGNSNTDKVYMIDCELFQIPCEIGQNITLKVFDNGNGYFSKEKNITITGAGYNLVENISLNTPMIISDVEVEDELTIPINEINLLPATTKQIGCTGKLKDYDGEDEIYNASAIFFDPNEATLSDSDDNNNHYTNDSCTINKSYGDSTEALANCTFNIEYYANAANWNCTINAYDIYSIQSQGSDTTLINELLALEVPNPIDFGLIDANKVSSELEINVTNYGNVEINLSLSGYAVSENDGLAMNCTMGNTREIPIYLEKFNLTESIEGNLTFTQFENNYTNLTKSPQIKEFNLTKRTDDITNDAKKATYWRVYVPMGVAGSCSGNIIFGAVRAPES